MTHSRFNNLVGWCLVAVLLIVAMLGIRAQAATGITTVIKQGFVTGQVSVDGTADLVRAQMGTRASIVITNIGLNTCYIGPASTVTTSTGKRLQADESITLDRNWGAVYAITAGGNTTVDFLEE